MAAQETPKLVAALERYFGRPYPYKKLDLVAVPERKDFSVYYAIVLQQHAFHGFDLNTYGVGLNALILGIYALALLALTTLVLRRSTIAH